MSAKKKSAEKKSPATAARPLPWDLYDVCVLDGARTSLFVHAVHGGTPTILREDFAASAPLSRAWVAWLEEHQAVAVEARESSLERAMGLPRLECLVGDPVTCKRKADVITALAFSVGQFHTRPALVQYLAASRKRLNKGGVLVLDLYGGARAFLAGQYVSAFQGLRGETITYTFEQRAANAVSGLVDVALTFAVDSPGKKLQHHRDAFTYHWRLWGLSEMREALQDAGFDTVEVYERLEEGADQEAPIHVRDVTATGVLEEAWVAYVVART